MDSSRDSAPQGSCAWAGAELSDSEQPQILEEIQIEDLAVDGICGVY